MDISYTAFTKEGICWVYGYILVWLLQQPMWHKYFSFEPFET